MTVKKEYLFEREIGERERLRTGGAKKGTQVLHRSNGIADVRGGPTIVAGVKTSGVRKYEPLYYEEEV